MQRYAPPIFDDADREARIKEFLPQIDIHFLESAKVHHFPGYAYGVMLDGKLIHAGSSGIIDLDKKTPASPHSMFRIASMTKSFTALAILILREEGLLSLDDPAHLYIPEVKHLRLTDDDPAITIRDLLIHTAGFPTDDPWGDRKLSETNAQFRNLLTSDLNFSNPLGVAYEYSNLGYTILGQIIDKISGISYSTYIDQKILQPLGMNEAAWDFTKVPENQLAKGYRWLDDAWTPEELLGHGVFGAMGGMIASIESFSLYAALHQLAWPPRDGPDIGPIKRSTLREMQQPFRFKELIANFKFSEGRECPVAYCYGYGLNWLRDSFGRTFVGHSGGLPGFGSNWFIMPEYGVGIILLANVTYAPATKINLDILDQLINKQQLKPRQLPPSQILEERKQALLKLLPNWDDAQNGEVFADNFFLDYPINLLKKETKILFDKAEKIVSISEITPQNQLRGSFIITGEKAKFQVTFALTPEQSPRIQQYQIKEI